MGTLEDEVYLAPIVATEISAVELTVMRTPKYC